MFTPSIRSVIRPLVLASIQASPEAFTTASPAGQLEIVEAAVKAAGLDYSKQILGAFVLFGRLRSGALLPGSAEHIALRTELTGTEPKPWHKTTRPQNFWEFAAMGWSDEQAAIPAIAEQVAFDDTTDATLYEELIAAYVRNHFGFGGLEDYADLRAVTVTDPTMRVFIDGVKALVRINHSNWFVEGAAAVLTPDEKASSASLKIKAEAAEKARKAEIAATRRATRLEEKRQAYSMFKESSFRILQDNGVSVSPVALAILEAPFETIYQAFNDEVTEFDPAIEQLARLLPSPGTTAPEGATAEELAEIAAEEKAGRIHMVVQFLLTSVNLVHPTWFRALDNGDIKVRRVPLKEKPATLSRAQRAIRNHIYDDLEKYKETELKAAIEAVFGYAPGALKDAVIIPRPADVPEAAEATEAAAGAKV